MNSHHKTYTRFFLKTLGCKVNQYESQAIRELLITAGFRESQEARDTDIFIINTCTVTGEADRESRSLVSAFNKMNPEARIVVTGCYVQKDADRIASLPGVSFVVSNDDKGKIGEILRRKLSGVMDEKGVERGASEHLKITDFKGMTKAFVKIQDGCENYCSYCKVPLVRQTLYSKPVMSVLEEVSGLVAKGFREIVLTGICLGAWGRADGAGLVNLLKEFDRVRGDFRVRLSSIEPKYVTDDLLNFIASHKFVCKHLHIPMQSGDDEVLKRMNRPYRAKDYLSIIDRAKEKIPGVAITTDIMIGFPAESNAQFNNTIALVKKIRPLRTHIFSYSKRDGTAASAFDGAIPDNIMKRRYTTLKTISINTSYLYRASFIGERLKVLVETKRDPLTGFLQGYSDNYVRILFEGRDSLMKDIVSVKVDYTNLMYTLGKAL